MGAHWWRRNGSGKGESGNPRFQDRRSIRKCVGELLCVLLLTVVVRTFVVQAFTIPSGSMLPTLQIGDDVLVEKVSYAFRPIQRRDVIVFKYPRDEHLDFVKRVIGLPGETLEIRGHQVLINGTRLIEPYAVYRGSPVVDPPAQFGPVVIPPRHLFMMGDNRDLSLDSRVWGFLDETKVVGRARLIYFSVRAEEPAQRSFLSSVFDGVVHPSWIRWRRIGDLIH
jgi:signal peptidase I